MSGSVVEGSPGDRLRDSSPEGSITYRLPEPPTDGVLAPDTAILLQDEEDSALEEGEKEESEETIHEGKQQDEEEEEERDMFKQHGRAGKYEYDRLPQTTDNLGSPRVSPADFTYENEVASQGGYAEAASSETQGYSSAEDSPLTPTGSYWPATEVRRRGSSSSTETERPTCSVCLSHDNVRQRRCCAALACSSCFRSYVSTQVNMGVVAVECLNCDVILNEKEVLASLDPTLRHTYRLLLGMRTRALRSVRVMSSYDGSNDEDDDDDESGSDVNTHTTCTVDVHDVGSDVGPDSMTQWAEVEDNVTGLANARKCPECQIFIQKRAGCYNIKCPVCGTKFCYKCGERLPHDASLHRNRNLTVHRPCCRCHSCGLCCGKFWSAVKECCCGRRWLQIVRLSLCFFVLALLAVVVIKASGVTL